MPKPIELSVGCNEASDLLPVRSPEVLAGHGARRGFWTVLDEGPVEQSLALLLERPDGRWKAHRVKANAGPEAGRTEDSEALAYAGGWVYAIGSHYGLKGGPLRPRRAFFSRFREVGAAREPVGLHIVRNQFRLHRLINDALRDAGLDLLKPGEGVEDSFIARTVAKGSARAKSWVARLTHDDLPCNIEAATFTPGGTLLLGVRYPVTAAGEPVLVEIAGVEGMFADEPVWPSVVGAYVVTGVTPPGRRNGFRALSARPDGGYDAVLGPIDGQGKGSTLLEDHPMAGDDVSRHVRFRLPETGREVPGELVAELAPLHNVEGIAEVDGVRYFVTDQEHRVELWVG